MVTIAVFLPDVSILLPLVQVIFVLVISAVVIKIIERYIPFFGA